jgi:hypothetical protein
LKLSAARMVGALALIFALAHVPFLATSLEDIDSVNFALGVRHFDVATHRPHPPGYPVYILAGKIATAITGVVMHGTESQVDAKALAIVSLLAGLFAIACLYAVFAGLNGSSWRAFDITALSATAITATCPLFWYLAARPMSDLPGLALALVAQACLLAAWLRQRPGPDGDKRLSPEMMAASGRMIVLGAFLAALSIGLRSQTVWFTVPLLLLVLVDRIGRGVAGAMLGSAVTFVAGGLVWGIPLLIASGGLSAYLAALGTQAGEDFAAGEMLYTNPGPRALALALMRTFIDPWDSSALGIVVLVLAALGVIQLLWKDRRSFAAVIALAGPYLIFHLLFQDTSFIRYALPLVPVIAFLAVWGVTLASARAVPIAAAIVSVAGVAIATPVLMAYAAEPAPTVRALAAMTAAARTAKPGALAMHQTFVRPLEAEDDSIAPQLPSPPRLEWLELEKYWQAGRIEPLWFLADPMRSDLALIDPASLRDATDFKWPLVARPAFGGMRPSAVRWYRIPAPGWFAEEGWSLSPETSGMAALRGKGPHLAPITAMVRRRPGAARVMIGGRNLGADGGAAAHFTMSIDGSIFEEWDAAPGFFLKVFDVPAGRLSGDGLFATVSVQSHAASGGAVMQTAIEQFDVQDDQSTIWGYDSGWQEAEFNTAFGVWRWTSDRATLRIAGPSRTVRITLTIESPLRYFDEAPLVHVRAGAREIASATIASTRDWTFEVPGDALAASNGEVTIETNKTFVPAERGAGVDKRRLGLRVFAVRVSDASNSLTAPESSR